MEQQQLSVDVVHYADEDVWVATSEDIRGLVVESHGIANFLADVVDVTVQLLELNEHLDADQLSMTRLGLRVKHETDADAPEQELKRPGLQLTELRLAAA